MGTKKAAVWVRIGGKGGGRRSGGVHRDRLVGHSRKEMRYVKPPFVLVTEPKRFYSRRHLMLNIKGRLFLIYFVGGFLHPRAIMFCFRALHPGLVERIVSSRVFSFEERRRGRLPI